MLSKNLRQIARSSSYSLDGQTNKGLSYIFEVKEGEEWKTWPGARKDSPQWWREIVLWNYGFGMYGRNGLLKDDVKNEMFHFAHRGRLRCGDETVQQFLFRHHRAADLQATNQQLPYSEQPNVDADHQYSRKHWDEFLAEEDEKNIVNAVTRDWDDGQGRLRYFVNYAWSRLPVILKERAMTKSVEINTRGQVVKNDSIATSLSRSAF